MDISELHALFFSLSALGSNHTKLTDVLSIHLGCVAAS